MDAQNETGVVRDQSSSRGSTFRRGFWCSRGRGRRGSANPRNSTTSAPSVGTHANGPPASTGPQLPPVKESEELRQESVDRPLTEVPSAVVPVSDQVNKPGSSPNNGSRRPSDRFERQYGRGSRAAYRSCRPRVQATKIQNDSKVNQANLPATPPNSLPQLTWSSPEWDSTASESHNQSSSPTNFANRGELHQQMLADGFQKGKEAEVVATHGPIINAPVTEDELQELTEAHNPSAKDIVIPATWLTEDIRSTTPSIGTWGCGSSPGDANRLVIDGKRFILGEAKVKPIEKWLDKVPPSSFWDQPHSHFTIDYWIVPRQWKEYELMELEGLTLEEFYGGYLSRLSMLGRMEFLPKPWWTFYLDDAKPFLRRPHQPNVQLNPKDEWYSCAKSKDSTAEAQIKSRTRDTAEPEPESQDPVPACPRKVEPLTRHVTPRGPSIITHNNQNRNPYRKPPVDRAYQGQANIYIRLATANDAEQLRDIYNHFVQNTWFVPEKTHLTLEQMQDRLLEVERAKWPWLVAVERSCRDRYATNGRRRRGNRDNLTTHQLFVSMEKIMGFAYAHDHISVDSTDHVTAQVQVWVLPECQNSKVGTTLMDRLLFCLLEHYEPFTDAEYRVFDSPFNIAGGCKRRVHSLLADMQYAPRGKDEERANIVQGFLGRYGFEQYGEQKEVGWRKNLYLNRKLFQRICRENADGAHSDLNAQWDTESITGGDPRYFRPEHDTFSAREERRLAAWCEANDDGLRPLPLDYKHLLCRC